MNIYVGNLAADVTDEDLKDLFSEYGSITSVKVIKDMYTGSSKGFGFVELSNNEKAKTSITELNAKELKGKSIIVNEARPKNDDNSNRGRGGRNFNNSNTSRTNRW